MLLDYWNERIATLEHELAEARAQIAAKDAALDALDEAHQITQQNLWQDITELRASLVGKEQEHQDFRLQNDAEWRAKLDHLKAQIAAKDAALAFYRDGFFYEPKRSKTGIDLSEWKPKEALLEDCGNRASAALKGKTE